MGRRGRNDDDFAREVDAHLALETDRLIRDGLSPQDAPRRPGARSGTSRERRSDSTNRGD